MKQVNLIIILVLIISCSNQKKCSEIQSITIDQKTPLEIKLSSISQEIKYIQLESPGDILISSIWKLKITSDYIFVFTNRIDDPIFVFDTFGKFIMKIALPGRGPGEVSSSIVDFAIDESKKFLFILVSNREILKFSFSGIFIDKIKLSGYASHIEVSNKRIYINYSYPDHFSNDNYSIAIYNYNGKLLNKLLNSSYLKTSLAEYNSSHRDELGIFQNINDTIVYWEPRKDTVYQIHNNSLIPKYCIKREGIFSTKVRGYFESEKFVFFPYIVFQNKMTTYIYNKNSFTGSLFVYPTDNIRLTQSYLFINDINNGWPFSPKGLCNNGYLWDYYFPFQLDSYINLISQDSKRLKVNKDDFFKNPIIMLVK